MIQKLFVLLFVVVTWPIFPFLGLVVAMKTTWKPLQVHYFLAYTSTLLKSSSNSQVLIVLFPKGGLRASDQDVEYSLDKSRKAYWVLSERAKRAGATGLAWRRFPEISNAAKYSWYRYSIYDGRSPINLVEGPFLMGLGFPGLVGAVVWSIRHHRKEKLPLDKGYSLQGPQLVSRTKFNDLKKSDGIGFQTLDLLTMKERLTGRKHSMTRIPRDEESSHFILMGDSGSGKSSLIRQLLVQIRSRDELAVVFDPELEFSPHFFRPNIDTLLNPTDQRMPFWTPSDEVRYPPEAAALAESLFPDKIRETTFFTESSRKIFAHLLRYKPTPQELTGWMKDMEELDKRISGTEMVAMLAKGAMGQRAAVQGTLNQAVAAFQLLPRESEAHGRWSAAEWTQNGDGWVFLPSTPTQRDSVKPLVSMWLDALILRLLEARHHRTVPVWFIVDELATLQRLPQLTAAITQGRKANIRMVLGFQGPAQLEALYGPQAQIMLSQPMTKVFMRTSEPDAANWISRSIGEVEVLRRETTHTRSIPNLLERRHRSISYHWQRHIEPLVMASTIAGLPNLNGYIKSRNLVVAAQFPRVPAECNETAFLPRPLPDLESLR